MKFLLACYGTRGDVEPGVAVGAELQRRGHEVRAAVPPDWVDFAEEAGLDAVAYGPNAQSWQDVHRDVLTHLSRKFWKVQDLLALVRKDRELFNQCWEDGHKKLMSLSDGADLILSTVIGEQVAANVAEYHRLSFATVHISPMRANSQLIPILPAPLGRYAMAASEWVGWTMLKKLEDAQRRELGLPKATAPLPRRIDKRGVLEIQAYDEVCYPGLAAEWAKFNGHRPFVGALTLEWPTDADDDVASWIATGRPPIFFGFGSMTVATPAAMVAMISAACAQLGERALVCTGGTDFGGVSRFDHVKVVGPINYAATFPACRALVHHGGVGTTAAGMRAGVPALILSTFGDQTVSAAGLRRLKVGLGRPLSATTRETLIADLRTILAPDYLSRARELATRMTKPAESVTAAADLMENFARTRGAG